MNDRDTTLSDISAIMRTFVAERNWQIFHTPKNLSMSLAIESAEVMELFQWLSPEQSMALAHDKSGKQQVADELSDVLAYLVSLANSMEIDLASAFESKMERVRMKYPVQVEKQEQEKGES